MSSFPELTPAEAYGDLDRYRLIDVREEHEFHGPLGFIEGAELFPLSSVESNAEEFTRSHRLLLICRSGGRSGKACESLQRLGVRDVTNLLGGMIAWNRESLPVVRTELATLRDVSESAIAWLAQVSASSRESARERLAGFLPEGGLASATPTTLKCALQALETELCGSSAPPDLEITMRAYERDLARIEAGR